MKFEIGWSVQDRVPFRKAMRIARSEGDADGGGDRPSTEEGIVVTGRRQESLGDECRHI